MGGGERQTPERDTFTSQNVLVIPRERWLGGGGGGGGERQTPEQDTFTSQNVLVIPR